MGLSVPQKLKILVLNYEYPPIGGGGGAVCEKVAVGLAGRAHEVRVQTVRMRGMPRRTVAAPGLDVYRTFAFRRRPDRCSVWEMALFLVTGTIPTFRHVLGWRPDVIHAHFAVPTGVLAWLAGKCCGVPYVLTAHLGDVPGAMPDRTDRLFRWVKPFTRPIWRGAAAISAVTGMVRDLAVKAYGVPVAVIRNPLEEVGRKRNRGKGRPLRLVFAGRMDPQKNLVFLAEVLGGIRQSEWELHLVGDGPEWGKLRQAVEREGIGDRVVFHGWLSRERVTEVMSDSDILVLPSLNEGLPVSGLQALALGLPIVGSDIAGLRDLVVHEENGFLIPVGNVSLFREKLRLLLTDNELVARFGQKSLEMAKMFDPEAILTQYEDLLRHAALKRNR